MCNSSLFMIYHYDNMSYYYCIQFTTLLTLDSREGVDPVKSNYCIIKAISLKFSHKLRINYPDLPLEHIH